MRTVKYEPFPFEILDRYNSVEVAKHDGIHSSHIWAYIEGEGEHCYAPPHVTDGVSHFVVTAEQHDCGTYYVAENTNDAKPQQEIIN